MTCNISVAMGLLVEFVKNVNNISFSTSLLQKLVKFGNSIFTGIDNNKGSCHTNRKNVRILQGFFAHFMVAMVTALL